MTATRYHAHEHARGIDVAELERQLHATVRGEVRFDPGSRGAYATDASNFRQVPLGVVLPLDVDDMIAAVAACRDHGAPITHRGGGTGLAGQTTNVAVIIDSSKHLDRLVELNVEEGWAWVEPGLVLDRLRDAAEEHDLTFGPDPSTHNRCTLGGMIGNNSCGVHSLLAGSTVHNVEELDVLLYDGTRLTVGATDDDELERICAGDDRRGGIYRALRMIRDRHGESIRRRVPDIPRRVSGYNLDDLLPERGMHVARSLVGTEGTCVTVLGAKVRLVPSPRVRTLVVCGYPDISAAADDIAEVLSHHPVGCEGIDDLLIESMRRNELHLEDLRKLPEGNGFLLVEFGGDDSAAADERARSFMDAMARRSVPPTMVRFDGPEEQERVWRVREAGLGATARVPGSPDAWPGWEDSSVPPDRLGDYLRELRQLYEDHGYRAAVYGHFGQGCVHSRIPFDLLTQPGIDQYRRFVDAATDLVIRYGGSLSGEHGDGQQRAALLERMYGTELLGAFKEFKATWDPDDRMNPGKVVDPLRAFDLDENLRLGTSYQPVEVRTAFSFREDDGSFARATLRCVGVGACRRTDGEGVMCPSYMVTKEEEHSTRGRARLLFELLEGDVITDGWRSKAVHDALDLCLSCKGCKSDCPVNVDMATYKAEFLSHHWKRRLRPRQAYALGLIMFHARLAARVPRVANAALRAPVLGAALKRAAGVTTARAAPTFARRTFRAWFEGRSRPNPGGPRILLFPDTFTNHFDVDVGVAATEALEAGGFDVAIPSRTLCCGRPLFDYGMLATAKRLFHQTLEVLREEIRAGTPVLVLEPSCAAAFRDELPGLLPQDQDAHRLASQTVTFAELLDRDAPDWELPRGPSDRPDVLLWRHCHQHAVLGMDAERSVLERLGARIIEPSSGCCGLAGSWGFEADKHELSLQCGELSLFPAARQAPADATIVADGFSCRTQLDHGVGRRGVHLAQVVHAALGAGASGDGVRGAGGSRTGIGRR